MIALRESFNPEYLHVATVPRDGNNLDVEFRKAFARVEDALVSIMIRVKGTRDVREITNRGLAPLLSAGVVNERLLVRYQNLAFYGNTVKKSGERLAEATPIRSRYIKPAVDDRLPGSCLPLDMKQMKKLIRESGSLAGRFEKILPRIKAH